MRSTRTRAVVVKDSIGAGGVHLTSFARLIVTVRQSVARSDAGGAGRARWNRRHCRRRRWTCDGGGGVGFRSSVAAVETGVARVVARLCVVTPFQPGIADGVRHRTEALLGLAVIADDEGRTAVAGLVGTVAESVAGLDASRSSGRTALAEFISAVDDLVGVRPVDVFLSPDPLRRGADAGYPTPRSDSVGPDLERSRPEGVVERRLLPALEVAVRAFPRTVGQEKFGRAEYASHHSAIGRLYGHGTRVPQQRDVIAIRPVVCPVEIGIARPVDVYVEFVVGCDVEITPFRRAERQRVLLGSRRRRGHHEGTN